MHPIKRPFVPPLRVPVVCPNLRGQVPLATERQRESLELDWLMRLPWHVEVAIKDEAGWQSLPVDSFLVTASSMIDYADGQAGHDTASENAEEKDGSASLGEGAEGASGGSRLGVRVRGVVLGGEGMPLPKNILNGDIEMQACLCLGSRAVDPVTGELGGELPSLVTHSAGGLGATLNSSLHRAHRRDEAQVMAKASDTPTSISRGARASFTALMTRETSTASRGSVSPSLASVQEGGSTEMEGGETKGEGGSGDRFGSRAQSDTNASDFPCVGPGDDADASWEWMSRSTRDQVFRSFPSSQLPGHERTGSGMMAHQDMEPVVEGVLVPGQRARWIVQRTWNPLAASNPQRSSNASPMARGSTASSMASAGGARGGARSSASTIVSEQDDEDNNGTNAVVHLVAVEFCLALEPKMVAYTPQPVHMFGQLAKTTRGQAYLRESAIVPGIMRSLDDPYTATLEQRSALWSIGTRDTSEMSDAAVCVT
jgi:hypothetical protein